jgi:F-type H+-transporting ATPase subunit a
MSVRSMKSLLVAALSVVMLFLSNVLMAQDAHHATPDSAAPAAHGEAGKFNVTETILEHIKDDHSWHLWGHTSIHLPVILYSDKGLDIFSSGNLVDEHHQPVAYAGNYNYKLVHGKV